MTLTELETIIRSHLNDASIFDIVLITSASCMHCDHIKQAYATLEHANTNFYHIEFDELPTLFASPGVPSVTLFNQGVKMYEAAISGNINVQRIINLVEMFKSDSLPGPIVLT